jgi:Leucine-rich repeat (LRR) protein
VRDLSPIRGGGRLEEIDLSGTRVFDFSPLSTLPVKSFAANDSQLREIGFMRQWQLESLEISNTRVYDFSVLSRMPLKRLAAANTQLKTLEHFRNCPLEDLDISGSGIRDINPMGNFSKTLKRLKMDGLPVRALDIFRTLDLRELSMDDTKIDNLLFLSHMQLVDLSIKNTPVATLNGLPVNQLVNLQIEGTRVTSLEELRNASALRRLNCRNTRINNLTPIYGSGITHLFVDEPGRKGEVFRQIPSLVVFN